MAIVKFYTDPHPELPPQFSNILAPLVIKIIKVWHQILLTLPPLQTAGAC